MTLRELEPEFLKVTSRESFHLTNRLSEADGIFFLCPKCFEANKGPVGTHGCICWFVGHVPDDLHPGPARWTPSGTGEDDLSLAPSVQLIGGCAAHFYIRNGAIDMC